MGKLTELRGALGGGLAAITWTGQLPSIVTSRRVRVVQDKREVKIRMCVSLLNMPLILSLI